MSSSSFQTIAALAIVALAAGGLAWRTIARRRRPGCGGDCGCPANEFKEALKK